MSLITFEFLCVVIVVFGLRQPLLVTSTQNVGVTLESNSTNLPNNAIVSANQIGSVAGEALACFTDNDTFNIGEWFSPEGVLIQTNPSDTVYNLRGPGTVMLYCTRGLSDNMEGIYTCRIPDAEGREHVLYVGVYKQENFVSGTPMVPDPPSFSLLTPFDQFPPTFVLSCVSTSYPPTSVAWLLDGDLIDTDVNEDFQTSQMLLSTASTTFDNVLTVFGNYSGEFSCEITNSIGTMESVLTVAMPATPPFLMDPEFLGSGNVSINWTQPEGDVRGYQLFYKLSSDSDTGSEVVINITSPDKTHVMLFNLLASATYDVTILVYDDLPTERSEVLQITLNVAGFAENFSVVAVSLTSLNVSWFHPGENVVGYDLHYIPAGTGCPGINGGSVPSISSDSVDYTLTDLEEDTEYNVTITTISEAAMVIPPALSLQEP